MDPVCVANGETRSLDINMVLADEWWYGILVKDVLHLLICGTFI